MNKAVFLDRDGVINKLVFNSQTKEYEPPHSPEDFKFFEFTIDSLKLLFTNGFKLILVSNQPDFAKGKTSLENLKSVHSYFERELEKNAIFFSSFNYCYHHPQGIMEDFSFDCECRKPKTYFIDKSTIEFNIDLNNSWLIGDRDSDILCGKNSGLNTILILNPESANFTGNTNPDFVANNLREAVELIVK